MGFTTKKRLQTSDDTLTGDAAQAINADLLTLDNSAMYSRGAWGSATTYQINDVVSASGTYYIATAISTNHTPPNTSYWQPFSPAPNLSAYLPLAGGTLSGEVTFENWVTVDNAGLNFTQNSSYVFGIYANDSVGGGGFEDSFGDNINLNNNSIQITTGSNGPITTNNNTLDDGYGDMTVTGTLNLPSTGTITSGGSESLSVLGTNGLYLSGGYQPITTSGGTTLDDGYGNMYLPYGGQLGLGGNGSGVYLQSYDGYLNIISDNYIQLNVDGYTWTFDYGGGLQFPDGSTQHTAYTGSSTSSLSAVCAVGNTTTTNISLTGSTSSLLLNTGYIGWQNSTSTAIGGSSSAIAFYIGGMFRVSINATGFSGDISQCTGLNAGNISTGTINNARLPSAISVSTISGGYISPITTKTAAYTIATSDSVILCNANSAAFTVTLPAISTAGTGREYTIKKTDNAVHTVTVATTSSQTIDGATTYSLTTPNQYVTVTNDGTYWWIIANGTA